MHLFPLLGKVVILPAVFGELEELSRASGLPDSIHVLNLSEKSAAQANDWCKAGLVDRGEAHAIALARQESADVFLTDDASARLLATSLGLHARGSLGVILWLAGQRRIPMKDAARCLEELAHTSLWVSPRVVAEARAALSKISGA